MSSLVISVPGKSFLAGEYLALKEGPSLVFASKPRFELRVASGAGEVDGIHADSPAGKLIRENQNFFKKYDLNFMDPHQGQGGWGASTAQFLATFVLNEWRESCELETLKSLSISRLLDSYWKHAWSGEGLRPSGADLAAQYKGSLTYFDKRSGLISVYGWPFHDLDFALIPTGQKLPTHEHLKTLKDFDESALAQAMKQIVLGLQNGRAENFVSGIRDYGSALQKLNLVAPHTQKLIAEYLQKPGVLAAKGCGALGADVILVVYEKNKAGSLQNEVGISSLSHGLEIQVKN